MKPKAKRSRPRLLSPDVHVVLTKADVAALLRISEPSVDRLVKQGKLRRLPGLRRILIPRASVDQLLASVREVAS